jgi:hypothetical protein
MPLDWLYAQVHPAVAGLLAVLYAVAAFVHPLWTRWRIRRGAPVFRYRQWSVAGHLVAILLLVTMVPGVDAVNLGLGWSGGRGWPAALGITAAFVTIVVAATARVYGIRKAGGSYVDDPLPDLPEIADKVVGSSRDALLFVAVPLFIAVGAFDLPLAWTVVAAMLGYGFHHLSMGPVAVVSWTGYAGVALVVYLLSGHVALPTVVIVAAALIRDYAWPRAPAEPPPVPALTVIEPPMPLR